MKFFKEHDDINPLTSRPKGKSPTTLPNVAGYKGAAQGHLDLVQLPRRVSQESDTFLAGTNITSESFSIPVLNPGLLL